MVVSGFSSLTFRIAAFHRPLPNSSRSSLSTEVITHCFTPMDFTDCASLSGSSQSTGKGLPVGTEQNLHRLVHIFPRIINVAVPWFQHSPIFGQFPLVHMVCRFWRITRFLTRE